MNMRVYLFCSVALALGLSTQAYAQTADTRCSQNMSGSVNCRTEYQSVVPRKSTADALFEFGAAMRQERQVREIEKQTAILEAMNAESNRREQAEDAARQRDFEGRRDQSLYRSIVVAVEDGRCDDATALIYSFGRNDLNALTAPCAGTPRGRKYRPVEMTDVALINKLLIQAARPSYVGDGVPVDYAFAAHLLGIAANQGNRSAQYAMAGMYLNGMGVAKSATQARRLFKLAAAQGDSKAVEALASMPPEAPTKRKKLAYRAP